MNKMTDHMERFKNTGIIAGQNEVGLRGFGVVNPFPEKLGIIIRDHPEDIGSIIAYKICPNAYEECKGAKDERIFEKICMNYGDYACSPKIGKELTEDLDPTQNWIKFIHKK